MDASKRARQLAAQLGVLRRKQGLTQVQVIEIAQMQAIENGDGHLTQSALSAYETGVICPRLDSMVRAAWALGYDLALVPREEKK